jgi:hypothetical protein
MCKLEDNVSLWNAFILYEAYYTSKAPKPNRSCQNVMDFKHWVSELCDSMSNRKQKTLTSPTKHIYFTHQNRQNENHSQSSKITQDYILEHGTVSALLLIPGWKKDL